MGAIASPITSLTIVYSTVYSDADQRKHQSSASLAFVRGIRTHSLQQDRPDRLKIAKVIPLFKKGDQHILDNYRPISLLPVISKVFEKIVFDQLYQYFTDNDLIFTSQYGFRKLHSTELASIELIDRIAQYMDSGKLPLSIFLDLSKAFDTLDHSILLDKLKFCGISNTPLKWFQSYLRSRQQFVVGIWWDMLWDYFYQHRCAPGVNSRTTFILNLHEWHTHGQR